MLPYPYAYGDKFPLVWLSGLKLPLYGDMLPTEYGLFDEYGERFPTDPSSE
jgi:hypothetical protein